MAGDNVPPLAVAEGGVMSWNISHDGRIECLDDGPRVPWWLAQDDDYPDDTPATVSPTETERFRCTQSAY